MSSNPFPARRLILNTYADDTDASKALTMDGKPRYSASNRPEDFALRDKVSYNPLLIYSTAWNLSKLLNIESATVVLLLFILFLNSATPDLKAVDRVHYFEELLTILSASLFILMPTWQSCNTMTLKRKAQNMIPLP